MLETGSIGFATALVAGVVSFLSPCVLPLVPGYLSYIAGTSLEELRDRQSARLQALGYALCFVLGFSVVHTLAYIGLTFTHPALVASFGWVALATGVLLPVYSVAGLIAELGARGTRAAVVLTAEEIDEINNGGEVDVEAILAGPGEGAARGMANGNGNVSAAADEVTQPVSPPVAASSRLTELDTDIDVSDPAPPKAMQSQPTSEPVPMDRSPSQAILSRSTENAVESA